MTFRQKMLRLFYPLIMKGGKLSGANKTMQENTQQQAPAVPFHQLQATLGSGKPYAFAPLQGRYVLIANTASQCGYTGQYAQLQELQQAFANKLVVLGFPANDFGEQEPGTDSDIASFCQVNYGVSFPIMQKAPVTGPAAQPVFQWLTQPAQNGWNQQQPSWNFCKYLIGPDGALIGFYPSAISPLDESIIRHLEA